MISVYEKRIRKLEEQKALVAEKIAHCGHPLRNFDETLQTSLAFLANPWNHWVSPRFEDKKAVLRLAFDENLAYVRGEGFQTPNLSLPFKVLEDFSAGKNELARPEGFEPPTCGFGLGR